MRQNISFLNRTLHTLNTPNQITLLKLAQSLRDQRRRDLRLSSDILSPDAICVCLFDTLVNTLLVTIEGYDLFGGFARSSCPGEFSFEFYCAKEAVAGEEVDQGHEVLGGGEFAEFEERFLVKVVGARAVFVHGVERYCLVERVGFVGYIVTGGGGGHGGGRW